MGRIARCDKLWKHKSSKARGEEQDQRETTGSEGSPVNGEQTGHYIDRAGQEAECLVEK